MTNSDADYTQLHIRLSDAEKLAIAESAWRARKSINSWVMDALRTALARPPEALTASRLNANGPNALRDGSESS